MSGADRAATARDGRTELSDRWEWTGIIAIGVAAAGLLWFLAGPRGLGITNDGVAYLATAESIVRGDGPRYWLHDPFVGWPLGYPVVLAGVMRLTGTAARDAALLVAMLGTVGLAVATGLLARRTVVARPLRLAAVVAVVFGPAVLAVQDRVLSDGLGLTGTLLVVAALLRATGDDRTRWVVLAGSLASALFAVRYAGVALVGIGAVVLVLFPVSMPRSRRLGRAGMFALVGLLVPVLYLLRNRAVSGAFLLQRSAGDPLAATSAGLDQVPVTAARWAFTRSGTGTAWTMVGLLVLLGVTIAAAAFLRAGRWPAADPDPSGDPPVVGPVAEGRAVVALCWLGLLAFFVGLRMTLAFDLDARTLVGLYPLSVVLIAAVADRTRTAPSPTRAVGVLARLAMGGFVIWSLVVAAMGVRDGLLVRRDGTGYLARDRDATYAELRAADLASLPPGCELHSNQPNVAYFAGIEASFTPAPGRVGDPAGNGVDGAADPADDDAASPTAPLRCVVWISGGPPPAVALAPLDEVVASWDLERVHDSERVQVFVERP